MKDYYRILEVHELASQEMIKTSYRLLSKRMHPDVCASSNAMYLINEAYDVLSNPVKRKAYDEMKVKDFSTFFGSDAKLLIDEHKGTTFLMIKFVLDRYMDAIQSKDYNRAFSLLSEKTKEILFKKDFIRWQSLISEVHIIETFKSGLERIESKERIVFKVKVVEFNVLMNQYEEDYFERVLIFEQGKWRILLNRVNVDKVISKYKRILARNKGKEMLVRRYFHAGDQKIHSGYVTKENFLNVALYEFKRYKRYKRPFSLLALRLKFNPKGYRKDQLINFLERLLRSFDVFCFIADRILIILLPETKENQIESVMNKLSININDEFGDIIDVMASKEVEAHNHSVKHIINQLIKGCRRYDK